MKYEIFQLDNYHVVKEKYLRFYPDKFNFILNRIFNKTSLNQEFMNLYR